MMLIKPALLSYPGILIVSLLASGYRHDNRVVMTLAAAFVIRFHERTTTA